MKLDESKIIDIECDHIRTLEIKKITYSLNCELLGIKSFYLISGGSQVAAVKVYQ